LHPWREVAYAFVAVAAVIGVGQLYQRGLLLPARGALGVLAECINQVLIFSPLGTLLLVRRQSLWSAWVPLDRVWARLLVGGVLALLAIGVFTVAREGSDSWRAVVTRVYRPAHAAHGVQVLLEDLAITVLLARLGAACGSRPWIALLAVAGLFAAGHIPAMLSGDGVTPDALMSLGMDALLGVLVLGAVQRSRDIWWVWCVHFAMDMMQFKSVRTG
jgi:hypothetical protein